MQNLSRFKRNQTIILVCSVGALCLGVGIGIGASSSTAAPAAANRVSTADHTPQPTATVTETAKPVQVEVTPPVCMEAFQLSGGVMGLMAEAQGKAGPAIEAAFYRDQAALEAITSGLTDINAQVEAQMPAAVAAIEECKALAK